MLSTFRGARLGASARRLGALLVVVAVGLGPVVIGDPAGAAETRLNPEADARVEKSKPTSNFGSSSRLVADRSPETEAYLRFQVPALDGVVTKATLRLRVEDSTKNGPEVSATANDWAESTITWNDRPLPGVLLDDTGKLKRGSWATYDVTAAVKGPGPVSFHLGPDTSDGVTFTSRQSSKNRPELVVETASLPTTTSSTTTSTTAPTTTSTSTSTTSTSTTTTSTSTTTTSTTTTSTTTTSTTTTSTTLPPTSSTTTTPTTEPPDESPVAEVDEPWLGLARLVTETCDPQCARTVYSLSVEDVSPTHTGDQRSAFRFPPGQSEVLRLEWARTAAGGGCGPTVDVTMEVSLRRPGGARIGSAVWDAEILGGCSGVLIQPFEFDSTPFNGEDDDPYDGVMEVYGRLTSAGDATGADTWGAAPQKPGETPGRYARGHLLSGGVMVGWHESGDDAAKLAANEAVIGEPFALVRSYSPTWKTPSNRVRDWLGQGKFVLWSVKPPVDPFGNQDWTPVADGSQDAMIRQQVQLLQSWAEAGNTQAGYIFHHEPHDNADVPDVIDKCDRPTDSEFPCAGSPIEFIDAYERIRAVIDELGADRVKLVYTATLSRAAETASGSNVPGSGDPMTQGTDGESVVSYADLIAHDSYNWYCFRSSCNWQFPDDAWGKGVTLAETQGRQLIIAETASHPGCVSTTFPPGVGCEDDESAPSPTRDDWLMRIGTWLESDEQARRWIVGFAYYHTLHSEDWRFIGQTGLFASGLEGWRNVFVVDSPLNNGLGGHDYFAQYGFNNL